MKVAVIGNGRGSTHPVFTSIPTALGHAATAIGVELECTTILTDNISSPEAALAGCDAVFSAPTPFVNLDVYYSLMTHIRENQIPWLGVCGGTQHMLVEFVRNVLDEPRAFHLETRPGGVDIACVTYLPDDLRVPNDGPLVDFRVEFERRSISRTFYQDSSAIEPFFANYTLRSDLVPRAEDKGLRISGVYPDGKSPCLFELNKHPFFVGALFQPQMRSTPETPHPLITTLLRLAL